MSEMKMPSHGEFCWNELATNDAGKAQEFYGKLFGWDFAPSGVSGAEDYRQIHIDGKPSGGIMPMTEEWGDAPPHWVTYISVNDVDETIEKVLENGGKVCVPAFDIPNVGRISMINDPSGAVFAVMRLAACETVN